MKKYAIYTACIGGYDEIEQPRVVSDLFDYVVFSDCLPEGNIGVWKVMPADFKEEVSQILLSRYIKTHPHELLPQYEAWIWGDANITFADTYIYNRFADWLSRDSMIAALPHPATDDVYEHIYEMCCFGVERDTNALRAMSYLQRNGYPAHHGLNETGISFRKNNEQIKTFNESWWKHIVNLSKRDQFSFNYVLYSQKMECDLILPANEPVIVSPHLLYYTHTRQRPTVKLGFSEKIRRLIRKQHPSIYPPFVRQYMRISLSAHYQARLNLWGWLMLPLHLFNIKFYIQVIQRKLKKKSNSNEKTLISNHTRL